MRGITNSNQNGAVGRFYGGLLLPLFGVIALNSAIAHAANVSLSWDPPTTNVDGQAYTNPQGFTLYRSPTSGVRGTPIAINNVSSYTIQNLGSGTYYFTITAVNTLGIESAPSNELLVNVASDGTVTSGAGSNPTPTPSVDPGGNPTGQPSPSGSATPNPSGMPTGNPTGTPGVGGSGTQHVRADLDGDAHSDIVLHRRSKKDGFMVTAFYPTTTSKLAGLPRLSTGEFGFSGDFDGDGKADYVELSTNKKSLVWNIQQSSDSKIITPRFGDIAYSALVGCFFDNDDKVDFATVNQRRLNLKSSETGQVTHKTISLAKGYRWTKATCADLDGDGIDELIVLAEKAPAIAAKTSAHKTRQATTNPQAIVAIGIDGKAKALQVVKNAVGIFAIDLEGNGKRTLGYYQKNSGSKGNLFLFKTIDAKSASKLAVGAFDGLTVSQLVTDGKLSEALTLSLRNNHLVSVNPTTGAITDLGRKLSGASLIASTGVANGSDVAAKTTAYRNALRRAKKKQHR